MVSRQSRERMRDYVVGRLEGSGIYVVKDVSHDCLQLKTNSEHSAYLYLHSSPDGAEEYNHALHKLIHQGDFVTNVFYKDGKNFFVLIDERKKSVLAKTTLKNYSMQQISEMIHLREKEKETLRLQGSKRLVYYQPDNTSEGGRLHEGLVSFPFIPVHASYSHLDMGVKGYDLIMANDGKALETMMLSGNKTVLSGNLKLHFSRKSPHLPVLWGSSTESSSLTREQISAGFSGDALKYFLRQTGTRFEDWGGDPEDIAGYINPD